MKMNQFGRIKDSNNMLVLQANNIAKALNENQSDFSEEVFQLMLMKCAEVGNRAMQEYFFPSDKGIMVSHSGCREIYAARCKERLLLLSSPEYKIEDDFHKSLLAPDFMERNAAVWNEIDESLQEHESLLAANLAYNALNVNTTMNQEKNLHMPEKAFLCNGTQYVYSDGIMFRFEQANECIKTENPIKKVNPETKRFMDYTEYLFNICREHCTEELHLRLNFRDLKELSESGRRVFYDFGMNKPKLPVQYLLFLCDAVPTAKFFCSADKTYTYSSAVAHDECLLCENIVFVTDCYGNEFIAAADISKGGFKLAKQTGQIQTVPDYAWINPQCRRMNIKDCEPDVMFLDKSCFPYISLPEIRKCTECYAENHKHDTEVESFISPVVMCQFDIFNEMLKRISLNQYLKETGAEIHENGIVFAFVRQPDDAVLILNCYEYTDGRIMPIAVYEEHDGECGYRITEAEATRL